MRVTSKTPNNIIAERIKVQSGPEVLLPAKEILSKTTVNQEEINLGGSTIQTRISSIQNAFSDIEKKITLLRDKLGIEESSSNGEVLTKIADFLSLKSPRLSDDFYTIPILYRYLNGYCNDLKEIKSNPNSTNQIAILNSAINLNEYLSEFFTKIEPIINSASSFNEHKVFSVIPQGDTLRSQTRINAKSFIVNPGHIEAGTIPELKLIMGTYLPLDKSEQFHSCSRLLAIAKPQKLEGECPPGQIDIQLDLTNQATFERLKQNNLIKLPCFAGYTTSQIKITDVKGEEKNLSEFKFARDITGLLYVQGLSGNEKLSYRLKKVTSKNKPDFSKLSEATKNLSPFPGSRSAFTILQTEIKKLNTVDAKIQKIKEYLKAQMPVDFCHPVVDSILGRCPDFYLAMDAMLFDKSHFTAYITKLLREFKVPAFNIENALIKEGTHDIKALVEPYINGVIYFDESGKLNTFDFTEIFNSAEITNKESLVKSLEGLSPKIPLLTNEEIYSELYSISSRHKKHKGKIENLEQVASYIDQRQAAFTTTIKAMESNNIQAFIDAYTEYRNLNNEYINYSNFLYSCKSIDENEKLTYYKGLGANSLEELDFLIQESLLKPSVDDFSYLAKNLNKLFAQEEVEKQKYFDENLSDESDDFDIRWTAKNWYTSDKYQNISKEDIESTKTYMELLRDLLKNISKDQLEIIWNEDEMQKTLQFLESRIMDEQYSESSAVKKNDLGLELNKTISFLPKTIRHELLDQAYSIKPITANYNIIRQSLNSNIHDKFTDAFYINEEGVCTLNPKSSNLEQVKRTYEKIIDDLLEKNEPKKLIKYLIDLARIKDIGLILSDEIKERITKQMAQISILNTDYVGNNQDQKYLHEYFLKVFTPYDNRSNSDPLSQFANLANLHLPKAKIDNLDQLNSVLASNIAIATEDNFCSINVLANITYLELLPDVEDWPSLKLWKECVAGTEKERQRKLLYDFLHKLPEYSSNDDLKRKLDDKLNRINADAEDFDENHLYSLLQEEVNIPLVFFLEYNSSPDKAYIEDLLKLQTKDSILTALKVRFAALADWKRLDIEKVLEETNLSTIKLSLLSFKDFGDVREQAINSNQSEEDDPTLPNYIFPSAVLESLKSFDREGVEGQQANHHAFYHTGSDYKNMLYARAKKHQVLEPIIEPASGNQGAGSTKFTQAGPGLEFIGTRAYRPGDKSRDIYWKGFAKIGLLQSINRISNTEHEDLHFIFNFDYKYKDFYKDLNATFNTIQNAFYKGRNCFLHLANSGQRLISIGPQDLKNILCSKDSIDDAFSKRTLDEDLFLSICNLKNIDPYGYKDFTDNDWESKFDSLCKRGDRVFLVGKIEDFEKSETRPRTILDYFAERKINYSKAVAS